MYVNMYLLDLNFKIAETVVTSGCIKEIYTNILK